MFGKKLEKVLPITVGSIKKIPTTNNTAIITDIIISFVSDISRKRYIKSKIQKLFRLPPSAHVTMHQTADLTFIFFDLVVKFVIGVSAMKQNWLLYL